MSEFIAGLGVGFGLGATVIITFYVVHLVLEKRKQRPQQEDFEKVTR